MLIVLVIIGIIAAALIPRIRFGQSRVRDTKRAIDVQQLSNNIALYYFDNNTYPRAKQTS